jgi:hypothetical protein
MFMRLLSAIVCLAAMAAMAYTVPANDRVKYNLDVGWRVYQGADTTGVTAVGFNDSTAAGWTVQTLPYAWNGTQAFSNESNVSTGVAYYRRHFYLPAADAGKKVFLEIEEARQAARVYVNGTYVGIHENGVVGFGMDISSYVHFGTTVNVIAVSVNNAEGYVETAGNNIGSSYQWDVGSYTTNFGGITQNAYLHVADSLYQTLPLFSNLSTTGVYIYGSNYSYGGLNAAGGPTGSATITAQSELKNESGTAQSVAYVADIVDMSGNLVQRLTGAAKVVNAHTMDTLVASGTVAGLNFWDLGYGYLYNVYTMLVVNGDTTDVVKTRTGFRGMQYTNGITQINGRIIQVRGFAMRSQNPWPAYGDAHAPWLTDFQHNLMDSCGANTIRPMQCAALKQEIESADRCGISYAMPAGDAEGDVTGGQWYQRAEAMRDAMDYFKNNPSVFYYECGNTAISAAQQESMEDTLTHYDPYGGRVEGCRDLIYNSYIQYAGEMMYIDKSRTVPRWEMEYCRDESSREFWDQWSPPYLHANGANTTAGEAYDENQDLYCQEAAERWYDYYSERPTTPTSLLGPNARASAGGCKIEFADGTTFARSSENYRKSGIVDGMRLPKDQYGAFRVMWDGQIEVKNKDVKIVGHWTYPAGTVKPVYVISNCAQVKLFVNGVSQGYGTPFAHTCFTWPSVTWEPGSDSAQGYDSLGNAIATAHDSRTTAGAKSALRLTAHTSPIGLQASGNDVALVDVEVIDGNGHRVDTATNMIAFTLSGPAVWRGGMASGLVGSGKTFTNNSPTNYIMATSLPVMCGINRVSVMTTTTPGTITLTATTSGLGAATITLTSIPAAVINDTVGGLTTAMLSDSLPSRLQALPPRVYENPAPVYIMPTSGSASSGTWANACDDNETTDWSGTWIQFNFPSQLVSSVHLKESGTSFKTATCPIAIIVGTDTVFKGVMGGTDDGTTGAFDTLTGTEGPLGYWHHDFTPVTGTTLKIAATTTAAPNVSEIEIYGPGTLVDGIKPQSNRILNSVMPAIRQYAGRIDLSMPGGAYRISLVDLSGREVFKQHGMASRNAETVSIATAKFAHGTYLLKVGSTGETIQKKVVVY